MLLQKFKSVKKRLFKKEKRQTSYDKTIFIKIPYSTDSLVIKFRDSLVRKTYKGKWERSLL